MVVGPGRREPRAVSTAPARVVLWSPPAGELRQLLPANLSVPPHQLAHAATATGREAGSGGRPGDGELEG